MLTYLDARHTDYTDECAEHEKWRLAFVGGPAFVDRYLKKLSIREDDADFLDRKIMAYCPAFAATAIVDIKNSIYQRTVDIVRDGGPKTYKEACDGQLGGVDLNLSTMSTFMGTKVLEELLVMRKVGILVDQANDLGITLSQKGSKHPYLGVYCTESILNWAYRIDGNEKYLTAVLLKETFDNVDQETGLPLGCIDRYRLMQLLNNEYGEPEAVKVSFYTEQEQTSANGIVTKAWGLQYAPIILEINRIPFEIIELPHSLMKNTADYQVALLNLEASDVQYARKANFPWFYEFYDPKTDQPFKKPPGQTGDTGANSTQAISRNVEVIGGLSKGRRYPAGTHAPGFVNPDPDTLRVSMEKGQQLKEDIRLLVNLNLSAIHPTRASAESKGVDQQGLEGSLSYIGLLLQKAENAIGVHWSNFEGAKTKPPKVTYPKTYSLKSDIERLTEAEKLGALKDVVPSTIYKKRLLKKMINITLGAEIKASDLEEMYKEIDQAQTLTSDPKQIIADHEAGLVGNETASLARGYPKGEVEKAKKDYAEKLARIAEAQGGQQDAARGGMGGGADGSAEKQGQQKRGEAKL